MPRTHARDPVRLRDLAPEAREAERALRAAERRVGVHQPLNHQARCLRQRVHLREGIGIASRCLCFLEFLDELAQVVFKVK